MSAVLIGEKTPQKIQLPANKQAKTLPRLHAGRKGVNQIFIIKRDSFVDIVAENARENLVISAKERRVSTRCVSSDCTKNTVQGVPATIDLLGSNTSPDYAWT